MTECKTGPRGWLLAAAPLLLAAALRAAYLGGLSTTPAYRVPVVDAAYHDAWARGLACGDWDYSQQHDVQAVRTAPCFRPPGYPYTLALVYRLCGTSPLWPRLGNMALGLASLWLLGAFAVRAYGRRVAWLTQLLAGCYWGLIYFEGELLEGPLLVLGAVGCLYGLLRAARAPRPAVQAAWAAAAGLFLGLHAIARPNILLAAPVLALWLGWQLWYLHGHWRALAAMAALTLATLAVILPVTVRNRVVGGEWVLISTNGGINLHIGNNDNANGLFVGTTSEFGSFGTSSVYEDILQGLAEAKGQAVTYREADRYFAVTALAWIRSHPWRTLVLAGRKLVYLASSVETGHNRVLHYERRKLPLLRWLPGNWGLLLALCAAAGMTAVVAGRRTDTAKALPASDSAAATWLVLLFVGAYGLSFLPFFVTGQYRMPLVPWLCLGAAVALERVWQALRRHDWRTVACAVVTVAAVYAASAANTLSFRPNLTKWLFDEGTAYEALGRNEEAIAFYRQATLTTGQTGKAWYNLGRLEAARGRPQQAIEAYRQALRAGLPDRSQVWNNLGNLLLRLRRPQEAVVALGEAVAAKPGFAEARSNYGAALLATGARQAAREQFEQALALSGGTLAFPWLQLGIMARQEGDHERAEGYFKRAVALRPELLSAIGRHRANDGPAR